MLDVVQVDRGGYLVFVTSIALGAAGGYIASEKDLVPHLKEKRAVLPEPSPSPPVPVIIDAGPAPAPAVVVDAGPICDDTTMVGELEACPPIGLPTIEGGCGGYANTRCNDWKQTMKPRVAQAAIACLDKLNGAERCDSKRVELCAHQALMNACPDHVTACDAITKTCASSSALECRLAMSGLKETGREALVECAKKHCADKGIVGCEAVAPPRAQ